MSSSSSVGLEKEAIKNLAVRHFLIKVDPLSFVEYLELKGKKRFIKNVGLWEKDLKGYVTIIPNFKEVLKEIKTKI